MTHTITALVENEHGTINRVVSLFRRRGFSLASFNAGDCEQPGFSRMTFVVEGDEDVLVQVLKQLEKLIDVVECGDLKPDARVMRELAFIKVAPASDDRPRLYDLVMEHHARTPKATAGEVVVEFTGEPAEIESLVAALASYNVREIVRTGPVAIGL